MSRAAAAVQQVGGEVTHKLGIINGVGATLTKAQTVALAAKAGITRITADRETAVSGTKETVLDTFEERTYSNNDGSVDWLTDWMETGDNGVATSGDVLIVNQGRLRTRRPGRMVQRALYLPEGSTATLSLNYMKLDFLDASQYVAIELSADGGSTWAEIGRLAGPGNDGDFVQASYDISAFAAPNTTLRFNNSSSMTSQSILLIDEVQVEYSNDIVSTEIVETMTDTFDQIAYSNNNGSVNWRSDWLEQGDDNNPQTGYVYVQTNAQLRVGQSNRSIQRSADLSEANWAFLSLNYNRTALDNGDYVALEISADGGANWTELDRFAGPQNDSAFNSNSYDISQFASPTWSSASAALPAA
jgi:hypothetical protein